MNTMRILLCGCGGRMGHMIASVAADRQDCIIAAGADLRTEDCPFPVTADPADCGEAVDVLIDFSNPAALEKTLHCAVERRLPLVLATTGLSDDQLAAVHTAAQTVPVFFSSNMSLGVALLCALAEKAAAVLGDSFNVEILEKHHNQKLDAPSGTALTLADSVAKGLTYTPDYVYDRHAVRQKRRPEEIGISSIRGGTIVGEHEVIFAGRDEVVTLSHQAQSREIFAVGALNAARFLLGKPAGMYSMADLLREV